MSNTISQKIKSLVTLFRDISANPLKVVDVKLFPMGTRIFFDYLYDENINKDADLYNVLIEDMKVSGIYTPLELITNPINLTTSIDKKNKQGNSVIYQLEEKNLLDMLLKTQMQIEEIKMEGKENNKLYMEAPSKIEKILTQMNVNKEATRMLTEFISALIMEVRSYKLDHSHVFIKLDEIKKENRSLTREERQQLGLDEILKKQNEIKANTDKLLRSLNALIKSTKENRSYKEQFDQLNYALKNTLEILPTIDYENVKAHEKLKKNEKRFMDEREQQLRKQIGEKSSGFDTVFKYMISLVYSELLWDRTNKKEKITSGDFLHNVNRKLLKKRLKEKLKIADPALYGMIVDVVRPPCKIIIFQNAGRSYFDENRDIMVIHNYLLNDSASDKKIREIAEAFAQAVLKYNQQLFNEYLNHIKTLYKNKYTGNDLIKLFKDQYVPCFMERFTNSGPEIWNSFCQGNPLLDFFTQKYFISKKR